tara:strand:- start:897 stop:1346 length:450 start_codon:yes stop_codon:yes gene_type:complete
LNYLLSINKQTLIILTIIIFFIITIFFGFQYFQINKYNVANINSIANNADITKPKFTINGNNQEIAITAKEGNFLSADEILLKKNVIFESNKFKIFSDQVVFNKKKLIASSSEKSKFVSKNTSITSNGFDIVDNGNIINFRGKTTLTLK